MCAKDRRSLFRMAALDVCTHLAGSLRQIAIRSKKHFSSVVAVHGTDALGLERVLDVLLEALPTLAPSEVTGQFEIGCSRVVIESDGLIVLTLGLLELALLAGNHGANPGSSGRIFRGYLSG